MVAAIALAEEGTLDGITPSLTAPETLDLEAVAHILTDITGRSIVGVIADDDEWRAGAIEGGLSPMVADFSLGMFQAARRGEFAVTDPTLEDVIGHAATSARTVLERLVAGK